MKTVKDVLSRDLNQKIEEIIKVDQTDEASVLSELTDYVATRHIQEQYRELFRAIAAAPSDPNEGIGVWISGFFGSGKSSFAKNLGYVLSNRSLLGKPASEIFKERIDDRRVGEYIDSILTRIPTDVIMFDVSVDLKVKEGSERIAEIMYTALLRELDYAEDYDIADLEMELEREGTLEKFKDLCLSKYRVGWSMVRKGASKFSRASALLHELDGSTYATADSWFQSLRGGKADVTVGEFVKRTFDLTARRRPGRALVYIIDEVGQYVARSADKIENLRAVVEQFGLESKNRIKAKQAIAPVWVVITSQEKLDEVVAAIDSKRVELAKLQDRFRHRVDLAPADISEVATRRVLLKKDEAIGVLRELYSNVSGRLNDALRLERTSRSSAVSAEDFVQFYPYPPHFVELSIDIMSGIRLQPGAPKHLGGSNRTIIKQAHEILISDRTKVADKPIGALVTLDLIFELVEGNLSSEKQKDISDIKQRYSNNPADGGMAVRVAKALALLEFVRDLPRTESNIAACLVDTAGEPAPVREVQASLKRLEEAQFVRNTEEGWKLQTAQEKNWETERRGHLSPRPKDRNDIVRDFLRGIFSDNALRNYKYLKTFRVGVVVDNLRVTEEGDISLLLYVADDSPSLPSKLEELRSDSRHEAHKNDLYFVFALTAEIDALVADLYASRIMVAKYEQMRAQNLINNEESASLQSEKAVVIRRNMLLQDRLTAVLCTGCALFQGIAKEADTLGRTVEEVFHGFYNDAMPKLYPKLPMGARALKGTEAEEVLKAANLSALTQVFYDGPNGLNLIAKEDGKFVPNPAADIAKEILDFLRREHSYGNKVTGKVLDDHFQGIGYGWDREVLRLVLAVLLRAGAVEVTYQGRRYRNHQDPQSRDVFTGVAAFRSASFAPRASIELKTLTTAVQYLEDLIGEEVEIEEGAIASAFKKLADEEMRLLLPVMAVSTANDLPVRDALQDYRQTIEAVLAAPSDDCVRILAGEGKSFKEAREVIRLIENATTETSLRTIRLGRFAANQLWPLIAFHIKDDKLRDDAFRLGELVKSPQFFTSLDEIATITNRIVNEYRGWYSDLHVDRDDRYALSLDDIKGMAEWTQLDSDPDAQAALLSPISSHFCDALDLTADAVICANCGASMRELEADIDARLERTQKVIDRLIELTLPEVDPNAVIETRVKVKEFFTGVLTSSDDVDKAVEDFRRHLLELVATGATVVVE